MTSLLEKKLLTPVQIGWLTLSHRVVMPAMSRLRAQPGSGIPSDLMLEYYRQRASHGGFIVSEATAIAASARGYYHAPGLYTKEQEAGWSRVTDAVHAKGGYMFAQLWHAGRTTHSAITGTEPVTASVDPAYAAASHVLVDTPEGFLPPSPHRALDKAEIADVLTQYAEAALHAKKAGFDGVEIMAANGHLIDFYKTTATSGPIRTAVRSRTARVFSSRSSGLWPMSGGGSGSGCASRRAEPIMAWPTAIRVRCFTTWQRASIASGSLTCISSSRG